MLRGVFEMAHKVLGKLLAPFPWLWADTEGLAELHTTTSSSANISDGS